MIRATGAKPMSPTTCQRIVHRTTCHRPLTIAAASAMVLAAAFLSGTWLFPSPTASAQDARNTNAAATRTQAEQDAFSALQRAGYRVIEVRTTKAGIIAKAVKDGREASLLVDSAGRIRER